MTTFPILLCYARVGPIMEKVTTFHHLITLVVVIFASAFLS